MSTCGRRLISSIIASGSLDDFMTLKLSPEMFKENEASLYNFVVGHIQQHGKIPHPDTIEAKLGDVLTDAPEPAAYYLKEVEKRFLHGRLKEIVLEAQDLLKDEDPDKCFNVMTDMLGDMYLQGRRQQLYDYRDAADVVLAEYAKKHSQMEDTGVFFGWPTLDNQMSGLLPGDFVTVVGRPQLGKTFFLLKGALHGWKKQKQVPGFFSLEMATLIINQRLAAMDSKQSLTHILKGALSSTAFKHVVAHLGNNKDAPRPLWVIDSNLAHTIDDVVMLCRQLKLTCAWVDAAYLLRMPGNSRLNKFERIAENAELLKQRVATDLGIPVVASYQFLRTPSKKKNKGEEKQTMDDVFGGDTMAQLSTVMLGLFEPESVETKKQRHIEILKGRNGEVGGFDVYWDFTHLGFEEIITPEKSDLQFMG